MCIFRTIMIIICTIWLSLFLLRLEKVIVFLYVWIGNQHKWNLIELDQSTQCT